MIQIYSEWNTDYNHNGDAVFDPISCTVDMELNGSWELTLEVPLDEDGKFQMLAVNAVISAPTPVGGNQLFRIYNTEKTEDSAIAYARPIFLDSARDVFLVDTRPTNLTGQEALDYLMNGTPYSGTSDIKLQMTAYYVRKNLIEALAGTEDNSFLSRWGGEIIYNNYNVDISVRQGEDRGLRVEFGRNIESIQEIIDVDSMVTRIVPVAFNGYTLDGDEPWVDSPIIDNYPIIYTKEIDFSDIRLTEDVTEGSDIVGYDTLEELREALKEQCALQFEDGVDKPSITYEINMTDLARTDLYADFKGLETVELGDTVHCYHRILGIETDARVIELVYDCTQRAITQITIGDYVQDYWENLNASISAAATTVDFDSVSTKIAYIESNYIRTNELEADIAGFGFLTADEAEITYAKITDLDAALISVNELLADYAKIDYVNATFLTADSAVIENLSVFAESVYTLLGGIGSFGTLDSIHLSSDNAVIDEAVIVNAIAGTVIADILNAGYINTDEITIKSDSGGYITSGATTQYYDSEGNIRIQIGLDESGNFTFILYDADGEGILIDENGIRASAVPDGLIVDSMVSETAAIQGSKLDIASVIESINDDGSTAINASKVTIGDTTLDAWYVTVQDWGDTTVVLQTQLTEIQGLIDAKVWETDFEELLDPVREELTSLSENYSEIRVELDGITEEVATLTTVENDHYLELSGQITTVTTTMDGLTSQVSEFEQQIEVFGDSIDTIEARIAAINGLANFTPYFCLWDSGTETPPDDEDLTPAICGDAVCGLTICGMEEGALWSTSEPATDEGMFKWVKYWLEFEDGTESWSTAYCLTDLYSRFAIDNNFEYLNTKIEQTSSAINITISESFGAIYETQDGILNTLEQYNTYFNFTSDGLRISKSNSPFAVLLGTERLSFTENDSEVAYISNSMLYIHDAEVITSLKIGGFRWEIGTTGNLNLVKVSESSYEDTGGDGDGGDEGGDEG